MKINLFLFIMMGAMLLTACNFPSMGGPTPSAEVVLPPSLSLETLQNATYHAPSFKMDVTLANGKFEEGSGLDYFLAEMLPEVAFGDLNEDGLEDVAFLLAENQGGTGIFVSLIVVLNQGGQPVQAGSVLIDDRPIIDSIAIQDYRIVLGVTVHGPNDPMVSPTFATIQSFYLFESGPTLVRFTSVTGGGSERSITISDPVNGTEVSGFVTLVGNMPIAPFENNLVYRVFDPQGTLLAVGSFLVDAEDMGASATFEETIDLSDVTPGTNIRLELVEKSPADGATIALDSVELLVK